MSQLSSQEVLLLSSALRAHDTVVCRARLAFELHRHVVDRELVAGARLDLAEYRRRLADTLVLEQDVSGKDVFAAPDRPDVQIVHVDDAGQRAQPLADDRDGRMFGCAFEQDVGRFAHDPHDPMTMIAATKSEIAGSTHDARVASTMRPPTATAKAPIASLPTWKSAALTLRLSRALRSKAAPIARLMTRPMPATAAMIFPCGTPGAPKRRTASRAISAVIASNNMPLTSAAKISKRAKP